MTAHAHADVPGHAEVSDQRPPLTDAQVDRVAALLRPYRDLMAKARDDAAKKSA